LKKKINIALADCYVIVSARIYGGKALFRSLEREMERFKTILEENNVIFLENLELR